MKHLPYTQIDVEDDVADWVFALIDEQFTADEPAAWVPETPYGDSWVDVLYRTSEQMMSVAIRGADRVAYLYPINEHHELRPGSPVSGPPAPTPPTSPEPPVETLSIPRSRFAVFYRKAAWPGQNGRPPEIMEQFVGPEHASEMIAALLEDKSVQFVGWQETGQSFVTMKGARG